MDSSIEELIGRLYDEALQELDNATKIFKSLQDQKETIERNRQYTETISYQVYE